MVLQYDTQKAQLEQKPKYVANFLDEWKQLLCSGPETKTHVFPPARPPGRPSTRLRSVCSHAWRTDGRTDGRTDNLFFPTNYNNQQQFLLKVGIIKETNTAPL